MDNLSDRGSPRGPFTFSDLVSQDLLRHIEQLITHGIIKDHITNPVYAAADVILHDVFEVPVAGSL